MVTGLGLGPLDVLLLPAALPVKGIMFVVEQVKDTVDKELFDEATVQKKLVALQMMYELGEVSESEFERTQAALVERLIAIKRALAEADAE